MWSVTRTHLMNRSFPTWERPSSGYWVWERVLALSILSSRYSPLTVWAGTRAKFLLRIVTRFAKFPVSSWFTPALLWST